ncbi:MAG: efflux RND transporter permease subunit [Verrucomicrobiota bacterium]
MKRDLNPRLSGGLIAWFTRNHVAANILMLFLIVGGIVSVTSMRTEIFPAIDPRLIYVSVPYPGATPDEVADSITRRIEEAVTGIEGVDRVTSVAGEGLGSVVVEMRDFADATQVYDEVETAVNSLTSFPPEDAERPSISRIRVTPDVMTLAIFGDAPESAIRHWTDTIEDGLQDLDGVSLTTIRGIRNYEISIEVSEAELRKYGLSLNDVGDLVRSFSTDISAGSIESQQGEVLLRVQERRYTQADYESIAIRTLEDGSVLRLRDLATVQDQFEDINLVSRYNGKPAAFIDIQRSESQDTLTIAKEINTYLETLSLPSGVELEVSNDQTIILADRISLMARNSILGFVLVFLILVLFLDLKLAVWTSAAIPISFLGGLMVIHFLGYSINMISLFALIVVLGIVVDDGVVTGESIFEEQEKAKGDPKAVLRGVLAVISPVTIGVLTTVCAFAPLFFSTGTIGQLIGVIPVVVIPILLISLVEAYFILPAHLASPSRWSVGILLRVRNRLSNLLDHFVKNHLLPAADFCMRWRYATMALFFAVGVIAAGMVQGGTVRFVFFPQVEGDLIQINLAMPIGTPFPTTEQTVAAIENAIEEARSTVDQDPEAESSIVSIATTVGSLKRGLSAVGAESGGHLANLTIQLTPSDYRDYSADEFVAMIRDQTSRLPGIDELTFQSSLVGEDPDIEFELFHSDYDLLKDASVALRDEMAAIKGTYNISTSLKDGKAEYLYRLTPEGLAVGLTPQELGRQLRSAYFGLEVERLQRGPSEVVVYVRYPKRDREELSSLDDTWITLRDGSKVALAEVAQPIIQTAPSKIESVDGRRIVRLTADADSRVTTPNVIVAKLESAVLPKLEQAYPGLSYLFAGETQEQAEDLQSLMRNMTIALLLIYVLLGGQLQSYLQPFVIMAAIPFGAVGAVFGHYLLGYDLTFVSLFGLVALTGIVVNDSVVMLDHMNQRIQSGIGITESARLAVARRFRPILLTTLSTCLGLLPILTETSIQAKFLVPMVVSLAMGILFATPIILVLVPCLNLIVEDGKQLLRRAFLSSWIAEDERLDQPTSPPVAP